MRGPEARTAKRQPSPEGPGGRYTNRAPEARHSFEIRKNQSTSLSTVLALTKRAGVSQSNIRLRLSAAPTALNVKRAYPALPDWADVWSSGLWPLHPREHDDNTTAIRPKLIEIASAVRPTSPVCRCIFILISSSSSFQTQSPPDTF